MKTVHANLKIWKDTSGTYPCINDLTKPCSRVGVAEPLLGVSKAVQRAHPPIPCNRFCAGCSEAGLSSGLTLLWFRPGGPIIIFCVKATGQPWPQPKLYWQPLGNVCKGQNRDRPLGRELHEPVGKAGWNTSQFRVWGHVESAITSDQQTKFGAKYNNIQFLLLDTGCYQASNSAI